MIDELFHTIYDYVLNEYLMKERENSIFCCKILFSSDLTRKTFSTEQYKCIHYVFSR